MNESDEIRELCALLRSRVPIVLIESHEEPRILKLLQKATNLEQQALFTWSIVDGLTRPARSTTEEGAIYNTNNLVDALKHIDKTLQNGVYVLCDAHPGMKDPVNSRLVREIALEHFRTARTLVFISPAFDEMPPELLRLAAHFRPHLPTRDEIRAILSDEASQYRAQSGEKPRADRAIVDQLVLHLVGLEHDDVRRLVRQALRADGEINAADLRRVQQTKHEAMGGTDALGFESSTVRFEHVGGLANLKRWLALRREPFMEAMDEGAVDRPRGIVLLGVQGGGKSLTARAIAGEWNVPLMRLDFGALYNKFYGETERNLRRAFAAAEGMAPCVLWIDEIEKGFAGAASTSNDGGLSRRMFGTLLNWMQEHTSPVFLVATANDIEALPPELLRKGRFDDIFFVDLPGAEARRKILAIHLRKRKQDPESFDLAMLGKRCEGYSGAEIEQAVISALHGVYADRAKQPAAALTTERLLEAILASPPLSVTMAEKINALRRWANGRCVPAD